MIITKENPEYYIASGALQFVENALENPDRIAISLESGTVIMVYIRGTIDYAADGNYRRWRLSGYNTRLTDPAAQFIYARLNRTDQQAMVVFSTNDYNVDGSYDGSQEEDESYYFIKIGSITSSSTEGRVISYDSGLLGTIAQVYRDLDNSFWELFDENGDTVEVRSQAIGVRPKNGWGIVSKTFISAFGINRGGSADDSGSWNGIGSRPIDGEEGSVDVPPVRTTEIIDSLTSERTDAALSANMGRYLKSLIDGKTVEITKDSIKSTLGISDWALESNKPSYAFSEITDKVAFSQLPDMYWANVKVSSSSASNTTPAFGSVKIGDATLSWDSVNKALKIDTGVYSDLFVSAFGVNNTGSLSASLADLSFVNINNPTNGQALVYDGTNWVNKNIQSGGGGVISFAQTGAGNAVTNISYANGTLTATKGITFLTEITDKQVSDALGFTPLSTTGNAASASRLNSSRKLWGNDFDGSADISGSIIMDNAARLMFRDSDKTPLSLVEFSDSTNGYFGYSLASRGYNSVYEGGNILFRTSTSHTEAMRITSNGNVVIGATSTSNKFEVNGTAKVTSLKIGDATLSWDATNKALKVNSGLYSDLFVSAFGANNTGSLSTALGDLSNVSITNPTNGQSLVYNGTSWVNQMVSGGSGTGTISFNQTGNGNAVTSLSFINGVLTATKGGNFESVGSTLPKFSSFSNFLSWNSDTEWGFSEWTTSTSNRPESYGTSLNFRDATTWYYRLAFGTSGRIYHYSGINTTAMTLRGTLAYTSDIPASLPASDVYAWAKAATKPSYNFSEIGSKPTTISGYGITDAITTGNIGSQSVAYATGSAVVHSAASITNLNSPTWGGEGALTYNMYSRTASNKPIELDNANFVMTMNCTKHGTAGYYGWQIAGADGDGALYARNFTAGTFYGWKQFAFKTSASGTLSVADGTVLTWTNGLLSKIG